MDRSRNCCASPPHKGPTWRPTVRWSSESSTHSHSPPARRPRGAAARAGKSSPWSRWEAGRGRLRRKKLALGLRRPKTPSGSLGRPQAPAKTPEDAGTRVPGATRGSLGVPFGGFGRPITPVERPDGPFWALRGLNFPRAPRGLKMALGAEPARAGGTDVVSCARGQVSNRRGWTASPVSARRGGRVRDVRAAECSPYGASQPSRTLEPGYPAPAFGMTSGAAVRRAARSHAPAARCAASRRQTAVLSTRSRVRPCLPSPRSPV